MRSTEVAFQGDRTPSVTQPTALNNITHTNSQLLAEHSNTFSFIQTCGALVMLIGCVTLLGHAIDSHLLTSFLPGYGTDISLPGSFAFVFFGLVLLQDFSRPRGHWQAVISTLLLMSVLGIGLYYLLGYLILAEFQLYLPLVQDFSEITTSFLSVLEFSAASTILLLFYRYRQAWWAINGLGLVGLWLLAVVVFAVVGYWVELPVLFSYMQSWPSIIAFGLIGIAFAQGTIRTPGLLFPLVSKDKRIKGLAFLSVLLAFLIMLTGIITINLFNAFTLDLVGKANMDALYIGFELSTVALSLLVLALSMRVLFFYETSLRTAAELQALNTQLEQRIQERTAELEKVSLQKSRVLSLVSHDLKTPLAAIGRFLEILAKDDSNFSEKQKELMGYITEGIAQMRAMVVNVLDRARIEAGKVTAHPSQINMGEFVYQLAPTIQTLAAEKDLTVELSVQPELQITADPLLLRQILLNLLSNAIKYNRYQGRVNLDIYEESNQQVLFVVRDTGLGIPAEQIPKLFTEFYRVGAGIGTVEGTGLGLACTKKLVELHNGTIDVSSVEDQGSTFQVSLPKGSLQPDPTPVALPANT